MKFTELMKGIYYGTLAVATIIYVAYWRKLTRSLNDKGDE